MVKINNLQKFWDTKLKHTEFMYYNKLISKLARVPRAGTRTVNTKKKQSHFGQ